jgi:hypothetical protein
MNIVKLKQWQVLFASRTIAVCDDWGERDDFHSFAAKFVVSGRGGSALTVDFFLSQLIN